MDNKIPLFVLNNFLKFERKIYQVFGLKLGRPLSLKLVLYFIVIAIFEAVVYFTPFIGKLINWLPFSVLVMIPILLAWLLSDVGTEGRSPVFFFRSFFSYHLRNMIEKKDYLRGRKIPRANDYQLDKYITFRMLNTDVVALEKTQTLGTLHTLVSNKEQKKLDSEVSIQSINSKNEEIHAINQQFFNSENINTAANENETSLEERESLALKDQFEKHLVNETNEQEKMSVEQFEIDKKELKKSGSQFFRNLKGRVQKITVNETEEIEALLVEENISNPNREVISEMKEIQDEERIEQLVTVENEPKKKIEESVVSNSNDQPQSNISFTKESNIRQEEKIQNVKQETSDSKRFVMPKLTVIKSEQKGPIRPQPKPIHKQEKLSTWRMMKMYMRSNARNKAKRKN